MRTTPLQLLVMSTLAVFNLAFRLAPVKTLTDPPRLAPEVTAASYPTADWVVLEETGVLNYLSPTDPSAGYFWTEHVRIKVLTPEGRRMASVYLHLDHNEEILEVRARSISTNGTVTDLGVNDLAYKNHSQPESLFFGDSHRLYFDVPGVEVGSIIETFTKKQIASHTGNFAWYFDRYDGPVVSSTFEVHVPADWSLLLKLREGTKSSTRAAQRSPNDAGEIWRWRYENLPPVEVEAWAPTQKRHVLQVLARGPNGAGLVTWDRIAQFYQNLVKQLPPLSKDDIEDLALPTSAEGLFDWVNQNTRYAAVYKGIEGYQPHPAAQVPRRGWGDCKGTANLLLELYRLNGITAYPALVTAAAFQPLGETMPSLQAFNHLVVARPLPQGGYQILDLTDKYTRFGELAPGLVGRELLIMKPEENVIYLPDPGPSDQIEVTWTLQGNQGILDAQVSGTGRTYWRRLVKAPQPQQKAAIEGLFADARGLDVQVAHIRSTANEDIEIRATFSARRLYAKAGAVKVLLLGKLWASADEFRVRRDRQQPILVGHPRKIIETVVYRNGSTEKVARLPPAQTWSTPNLGITLSVSQNEQETVLSRTTDYRVAQIQAEAREDLYQFAHHLYQTATEGLHLSMTSVALELRP